MFSPEMSSMFPSDFTAFSILSTFQTPYSSVANILVSYFWCYLAYFMRHGWRSGLEAGTGFACFETAPPAMAHKMDQVTPKIRDCLSKTLPTRSLNTSKEKAHLSAKSPTRAAKDTVSSALPMEPRGSVSPFSRARLRSALPAKLCK